MSFQINCGEASDYVKAYREKFKDAQWIEITKSLLHELLPLKSERHFSDDDEVRYKKFLKTMSTRVSALWNKVSKSKAYESGNICRNDILIDIEIDCPELIQSESQTLSQASTISTISSSQSKVLEYLDFQHDTTEPEQGPTYPQRKTFDELGLERKRQKTDDVYNEIIKLAAEGFKEKMSPIKLIAYLGARFAHSNEYKIGDELIKNEYKNYEVEKAFIDIQYNRLETKKPDIPTCIQLKSSLLIGRDKYTDMKVLLSPWVKLQPYDKLKTEIDTFLPEYEEWEGGFRSTLRNNAEMTIKRALYAKDISPDTEKAQRIVENGLFVC